MLKKKDEPFAPKVKWLRLLCEEKCCDKLFELKLGFMHNILTRRPLFSAVLTLREINVSKL